MPLELDASLAEQGMTPELMQTLSTFYTSGLVPLNGYHVAYRTSGRRALTLRGPDWIRMGRVVLAHELAVGAIAGNVL